MLLFAEPTADPGACWGASFEGLRAHGESLEARQNVGGWGTVGSHKQEFLARVAPVVCHAAQTS